MSVDTTPTDRRPVVEIAPRNHYATVTFNPFHFVDWFPPELWVTIVAEVKRRGFRHLLGTETLFVLNVRIEYSHALALAIACLAEGYLSQSDLWLSEAGEPPQLVGLKAESPLFVCSDAGYWGGFK
jgi:hypothetical protein